MPLATELSAEEANSGCLQTRQVEKLLDCGGNRARDALASELRGQVGSTRWYFGTNDCGIRAVIQIV